MVSSLDNWDGSLSSATRQNASRITDLAEGSGATSTVQDERINAAAGVGHGWHGMVTSMDINHAVRCLLDGLCILWLKSRSIYCSTTRQM